jgi:hypothetical protein
MGWIGSAVYLVAQKRLQGFSFFQLSSVPNIYFISNPHIFWVYYFSVSQCGALVPFAAVSGKTLIPCDVKEYVQRM